MDPGWAEAPSQAKKKKKARRSSEGKGKEPADEASLAREVFGGVVAEHEAARPRAGGARGAAASSSSLSAAAEDDTPRAAAWVDDDESLRVDLKSQARLKKLRKREGEGRVGGADLEQRLRAYHTARGASTTWATKKTDNNGDQRRKKRSALEAEVAASSKAVVDVDATSSDRIDIVRLKDANVEDPAKASVLALDFSDDLMLAGGLDKTLRLFRVDGDANRKVASVFFKDTPIHAARFVVPSSAVVGTHNMAQHVVVSGRRPYYYLYDVAAAAAQKVPRPRGSKDKSLERFALSPDGAWLAFTADDGRVSLADCRRSQWAATDLKMNGTARALAFGSDSNRLYAAGGDAEVYIWDLRSRRCVERFKDDGESTTSALAVVRQQHGGAFRLDDDDDHASSTGQNDFVAVASESGVVNVYSKDRAAVPLALLHQPHRSTPIRPIMSLRTAVDTVAFSHDASVLAVASKWAKDALRLVHLPSCRVFANWPTSNTPLHYVTALAFAPTQPLLAIGNDRGRVLLYRANKTFALRS